MAHVCATAYSDLSLLTGTRDRRVYRAFSQVLQRTVILKGTPPGGDEQARQTVVREFLRLRSLRHPALTGTLGLEHLTLPAQGTDHPEQLLACVMPFLEGPSLETLGRRTPAQTREWLETALELTAFLHHHRLTDLDLTPQHFIRTDSGWMLIDLDQVTEVNPFAERRLHGTLDWMAPELLDGTQGGFAGDLYSLGAIGYFALTGQPPPLEGNTEAELKRFYQEHSVPPLPKSIQKQDPSLAALIHALLERHPARRPASAEQALLTLSPHSRWRQKSPCQIPMPLPDKEGEGIPAPLGQERPWKALLELVTQPGTTEGEGPGRCLLVSPPGGGRTHVLRMLETELQRAGRPVLALQCEGAEGLSAPRPSLVQRMSRWLEQLEGSGEHSPDTGSGDHSPDTAVGARPLSPLASAVENPAQEAGPSPTPSEKEVSLPDRLNREANQLLKRIQGVKAHHEWPVVFLIDDAHQLELLDHEILARLCSLPDEPAFRLVLSVPEAAERADTEQAGTERAGTILPRLAHRQVRLDSLSEGSVRQLVEQLLGGTAAALRPELALLLRETAGAAGTLVSVLEPLWQRCDAGQSPLDVLAQQLRNREVPVLPSKTGESSSPEAQAMALARARELLEARDNGEEISDRELALAYLASSRPENAVGALKRLVDQALSRREYGQARGLLERWLSLALEPPQRVEPLQRMGWLLLNLQRKGEAQTFFEGALEACRVPGKVRAAVQDEALASAGHGRILLLSLHWQEARTRLEQALELLPPDKNQTLRAHWHLWLAFIALNEQTPESQEERLRRAALHLALAREAGVQADSFLALEHDYIGLLLEKSQGQPAVTLLSRLEPVVEKARAGQYPAKELRLLEVKLEILRTEKNWSALPPLIERMRSLARETFNLTAERELASNLAMIMSDMGESINAAAELERAIALAVHQKLKERELDYRHRRVDLLLSARQGSAAELELERSAVLAEEAGAEQQRRQRRLGYRVRRLQKHWAGLDAELAADEEANRAQQLWSEALELTCERLALALEENHPERELALLGAWSGADAEVKKCDQWKTLHTLAMRAHQQVGGVSEAGQAAGQMPVNLKSEGSGGAQTFRTGRSLRERIDSGAAQEEVLREVLKVLPSRQDPETIAQALAALAGRLLGGRGVVGRVHHLPEVAGAPLPKQEARFLSKKILKELKGKAKRIVCENVQVDSRFRESRSLQSNPQPGLLAWPIHDKEQKLIGYVMVDSLSTEDVVNEKVQSLFQLVAETAGTLLQEAEDRIRAEARLREAREAQGVSSVNSDLEDRLMQLVNSPAPDLIVLLLGPVGAGKTEYAREIMRRRKIPAENFVELNCSELNPETFISQLFGTEKGSFTGALEKYNEGLVKKVGKGILFLDEVGELDLDRQGKLLRFLQERKYRPLGSSGRQEVFEGWVICATSRELEAMVENGTFSAALYSRISSNIITIPSLQARGSAFLEQLFCDLAFRRLEIEHFPNLERRSFEQLFDEPARRFLLHYQWRFNARDVDNFIRNEGIMHFIRAGRQVGLEIVKKELMKSLKSSKGIETNTAEIQKPAEPQPLMPVQAYSSEWVTLSDCATYPAMKERQECQREEELMRRLQRNNGNIKRTSEELDVSIHTLYAARDAIKTRSANQTTGSAPSE